MQAKWKQKAMTKHHTSYFYISTFKDQNEVLSFPEELHFSTADTINSHLFFHGTS